MATVFKVVLIVWALLLLNIPVNAQNWLDSNEQAFEYFERGDTERAIEYARMAISQLLESTGKYNADYAQLNYNLGFFLERVENYTDAANAFIESVYALDALHGSGSDYHRDAYDGISYAFYQLKETGKAREYTRMLLDVEHRLNGRVSTNYETALHRLAWIEYDDGNFNNAEPAFLEALQLRQQIYGKESSQYANLARNIGSFYSDFGRMDEAIRYYEKERLSILSQHGEFSEEYAAVLREQGSFYLKTAGDTETAFGLHKKRVEIVLHLHGNANRQVMDMVESLAADYFNLEAYAESVYFREIVRDIIEAIFDTEDTNYAVALLNLGYTQSYAGLIDESITNLLECLRIYRNNIGATHAYTILGLQTLQQIASDNDLYEIALDTTDELLQVFETRLGKENTRYTMQLATKAMIYIDMEQYGNAVPYLKQAIEIESELREKSSHYHQYFIVLGGALMLLDDYDGTEHYLTQGLHYAENTFGRGLQYAAVLDMFFSLELARGNALWGRDVAENKLDLYHELTGPHSLKTIESWNDLGLILGQMNLSEESYNAFSRAAELSAQFLGEQHKEHVRALRGASESLENTERFDLAEDYILRALEIQTGLHGYEHPETGSLLLNLGRLYMQVHDYEEALEILTEAKRILEPHRLREFRDYASVLFHLGLVHTNMRNISEAIDYQRRAFDERTSRMQIDHPDVIESAVHLGYLSLQIKQPDTALEWYTNALELSLLRYGREHTKTATIMTGIGNSHQVKGDLNEALKWYEESIEIVNQIFGTHSVENLSNYSYISSLYREMNDYENMDLYNAPVLENYRTQALQQVSYLTESRQEQFFRFIEIINDMFINSYVDFVDEHPQAAERIMEISMFNKGLRLRSSSRLRNSIMQSEDPELLDLFDNWIGARAEIQALLQQPVELQTGRLETVEAYVEETERQLMARSRVFREDIESGSESSWTSIRDALDNGEAVIEFLSFFEYDRDGKQTGEIRNAAIILLPDADLPVYVDLGTETELQALLDRSGLDDAGFISGLYRQFGSAAVVQAEQFARGEELFNLIWEPLESHLQDVHTVFFSPAGTLNQLSFAAVPHSDEQINMLSDRYRLRQLGSVATVAALKGGQVRTPSRIKLYGGIDYDKHPASLIADATDGSRFRPDRLGTSNLSRGGSWTWLPGTLQEARQIYEIATQRNITVTLSEGADALEETFKKLSGNNSPDVIHIATHGFFFDNPQVNLSAVAITPDSRQTFFQQAQNPLNRSGLLFAGANYSWSGNPLPPGFEDGILTAYEVSGLYLPDTQLVVLSACETGLGDIRGSEGVFGLQRAFRMAGVQNLLMSLWEVPDRETAEFMTHFYESWLDGNSIADAFNATQEYMKERYPDEPFKWAAFVLLE